MADDLLHQAIALARAGQKSQARGLLLRIIASEPQTEAAWLWLADCAETPAERIRILESCVRAVPNGRAAGKALAALKASTPAPPFSQPLPDEPPAEAEPPTAEASAFTVSLDEISPEEFARVEAQAAAKIQRQLAREQAQGPDRLRKLKIQEARPGKASKARRRGKKAGLSTPALLALIVLMIIGILGIVLVSGGLLGVW